MTFKGKADSRPAEVIDVAEFIGKKGVKAKGKRISTYEVAKALFIEPFPEPEFTVEDEDEQGGGMIAEDAETVDLYARGYDIPMLREFIETGEVF